MSIVRIGEVAEIGRAKVVRAGTDLTIVGTLLMVDRAVQAATLLAEAGISAEVIDLRWIHPLDIETVGASIERTGRLLVVEEQVHAGGWGATVISELVQSGASFKRPPMAVSLPPEQPIPYSPELEDALIPSAARIVECARRLVSTVDL